MSRYFKYETDKMLACPCCGVKGMSEMFLNKLDAAREFADVPFSISSGYRCVEHNKTVGGKSNSAHIRGLAVDIRCSDSLNRGLILDALYNIGFDRVGVNKDFIHVDTDETLPAPRTWLY